MSSIFSSAAKTLLSKTLQTFLYKYLSDVDVEGVALPSFTGESEMGVRLSNVRLRDGAELMDLPGKKRKRKSRPKKSEETEEEDTTGNQIATPIQNGIAMTEAELSNAFKGEINLPSNHENDDDDDNDDDEIEIFMNGLRRTVETDDDNSDTRTIETFQSVQSAPPTPPQSTSKSFFVNCLPSFSTKASTRANEPEGEKNAKDDEGKELELLNKKKEEHMQHINGDQIKSPAEGNDNDKRRKGAPSAKPKEEEEYFFVEEDMVLRLGKGSTIGTLDVRMVGKEIHVLVEDAFLSVEAIPKKKNEEENIDSDGKKEPTKQAAEKPKTKPADKTTGDRIISNNPLAWILSVIPHLFLRDIRVRFVIRDSADEDEEDSNTNNDDEGIPEEQNVKDEEPYNNRSSLQDSVLEIGIDFLSVTSGDDFLASFRKESEDGTDADSNNLDDDDELHYNTSNLEPKEVNIGNKSSKNEFLIRRIRTGKGPDGGLWVKIYPPTENKHPPWRRQTVRSSSTVDRPSWAKERWTDSTKSVLLRLSAMDMRARVFMGTKAEIFAAMNSSYNWFGTVSENDDSVSENNDIDTMIGFDSVAPGPMPQMFMDDTETGSFFSPGKNQASSTAYQTDDNGIQSRKLESNFHRVARGLLPSICGRDHLPCEVCPMCWEKRNDKDNIIMDHPMDSSTPMPGVALYISLRDPLEVNVDRSSLDALGLIIGLFSGQKEAEIVDTEIPNVDTDDKQTEDEDIRTNKTVSIDLDEKISDDGGVSIKSDNLDTSFPAYMTPETIQCMGIYASDILIRVHVMKAGEYDQGLSYCYWDITAKCLTLDLHLLSAPTIKSFQDIRLDVGFLEAMEYKGTCQQKLLHGGFPFAEDELEVASLGETYDNKRPPWPTSLTSILDVPVPLESVIYENRERHFLQLRYMSLTDHNFVDGKDESITFDSRDYVNVQIGCSTADMPFALINQILTIIDEIMNCLFPSLPGADSTGTPSEDAKATEDKDSSSIVSKKGNSLLKYRVRFDGGRINMYPMIDVTLPLTTVAGENSSDTGFSIKALLDHADVKYGEICESSTPTPFFRGLSLFQIANLPESVRLRVLLFLDDLTPLEKALGVKTETNSFLRCRAVNKGLVKLSKKITKAMNKSNRGGKKNSKKKKTDHNNQQQSSSSITENSEQQRQRRRQSILTEILKLDDDALEKMWLSHKSKKKKKPVKSKSKKPKIVK